MYSELVDFAEFFMMKFCVVDAKTSAHMPVAKHLGLRSKVIFVGLQE